MKKITFLIISLSLLAVSCHKQTDTTNIAPPHYSIPNPQYQTYENDYMKVSIPVGWMAMPAMQTTTVNSVPVKSQNPAAVNIMKGNYILYINTEASQASGVEGGRFAEIAQGAPSADAVVVEQPSPPCGIEEASSASSTLSREDLYINDTEKQAYCKTPTNGKTVWYFSYVTKKSGGGYFNYYTPGQPAAYVITMAYSSTDINSFPEKGTATLQAALTDMTYMVQSLQIKKH